jgi:hypothetical protein
MQGIPSGQHVVLPVVPAGGAQTFAFLQHAPLTHFVPSGQQVTVPAEFVQTWAVAQHRPLTHVCPCGQHVAFAPVPVTHAFVQHLPPMHWLPSGQHVGFVVEAPQICAVAQHAPLMHLLPSGQHVTAPEAVFLHTWAFGQHRLRTQVWPSGQQVT